MKNSQNVIIDLDSLVDSRVGHLFRCYPAIFKDIEFDEVAKRPCMFKFNDLEEDVFKSTYSDRNTDDLKSARPTLLLYNLRSHLNPSYTKGIMQPTHEPLKLSINVYPYDLTDADAEELKNCIRSWTFDDLSIDIVSISTEDLTPSYLKSKYQILYMFNFVEWVELHRKELGECNIPKVVVYTPAFFVDEENGRICVEEEMNPFESAQKVLAEFISLQYIDRELFSITTI